MVLFSSILYLICKGSHWGLFVIEILFGLGFGWLTFYLNVKGVIFSTSFIGSYLIVRASSWFIGGYPNEWTLYEQLQNRAFQGYWKFYIYLIVLLVLTVVGIIAQIIILKKFPEEEKDAEDVLKKKDPIKENVMNMLHNATNSHYKEIKSDNTEKLNEGKDV